MTPQTLLKIWIEKVKDDNDLKSELKLLQDTAEIEDRFYRDLEFGTGGLRGLIGAGTNRMNIYTVGKATQGLANYLNQKREHHSVAIAYDSRIKSAEFAKRAAGVLAANGIDAHVFQELMPTPTLSYAVRALSCDAGIVITASHNPAAYNGYKVYGSDGCQITLEMANEVLNEIKRVDPFEDVNHEGFDEALNNGRIHWIPDGLVKNYIDEISEESLVSEKSNKEDLKIVYTPLHGAGLRCVVDILKKNGYTDLEVVESQKLPDGRFPTCPYPNPEVKEALKEGLRVCREVNADILLATDPDCDRVGIAVRSCQDFELLSGNEVGILLLDYICKRKAESRSMPKRPVCIKTIVTTDMVYPIAETHEVEVMEVLTGFKFIGETIGELEKAGRVDDYILGFEESYGYLTSTKVRDKDAVNASLLIVEMAAYHAKENKTLLDAMTDLYEKYGYYHNLLSSYDFPGKTGMETMNRFMEGLRNKTPKNLTGLKITTVTDYLNSNIVKMGQFVGKVNLPSSNVIRLEIGNIASVVVRPSGTEPKLKAYISTKLHSRTQSADLANLLKEALGQMVGEYQPR